MATPGNLAVVEQRNPGGSNPYNAPAYVSARVLAGGVAESITVPANATKVRLAANADIFYSFTTTAVVPAADVDDGTSNELIKAQGQPEWRTCQGVTSISVICAGAAIVTASFYTN